MTASQYQDSLNALELNLSHERSRFAAATLKGEIDLRAVWVAQLEREISSLKKNFGLEPLIVIDVTDDELLAQLGL
jgi:hypothetical protein